jgi:thiol peroxidase
MSEHTVTMHGDPLDLAGPLPAIGATAPDFVAVTNDLGEVRLSDLAGKTVVLSAVPSLDTPVCSLQTKRFNAEAAALGENVAILAISMDLPFAQKRWCGAEGVEAVQTVSDHRDAAFGSAYGVLLTGPRLLARAVFIVDADGTLAYAQLVPEITDEPDYDDVLAALATLTG